MSKTLLKYVEVGRTNVRSRWAYVWDQVLSTWFLAVILYVFVQLWKVTYAGQGALSLGGYTLADMIWYLVLTESIIFSLPRIHSVIEQEVREGDLALRLNKPYNYLLFHYSQFLGDSLLRLATCLLTGSLTAYLLIGSIAFPWRAVPVLLMIYLLTNGLNFALNAAVGLGAFWMEDVTGPFFVVEKIKWLLGGLLLPIEMYPDAIRRVVEVLPFRYMVAGPARLAIKFSWEGAGALLRSQALWLVLFGLLCAGLYRMGVRKVDLNSG
ncbi:MAG TPA: ABC-2 family transporter protein [Symbiobacteriaceae bacterium]|nr:ABC-2 family transporter protein [Symbiobacteriaceae bacterium]